MICNSSDTASGSYSSYNVFVTYFVPFLPLTQNLSIKTSSFAILQMYFIVRIFFYLPDPFVLFSGGGWSLHNRIDICNGLCRRKLTRWKAGHFGMAVLQSAWETGTVSTNQYIPPYLSQIISNKNRHQWNVRINLLLASVVLIDVERLETPWGFSIAKCLWWC